MNLNDEWILHLILNCPSNTNFKDFIDSPFTRVPLFPLFAYLVLFADRKKRFHSVLSVLYRSFILLMKLCRCLLVAYLYRRLRRYCCKGISFFKMNFQSCLSSRWYIWGNWVTIYSKNLGPVPPGMCVLLMHFLSLGVLKIVNFWLRVVTQCTVNCLKYRPFYVVRQVFFCELRRNCTPILATCVLRSLYLNLFAFVF